MGDANMYAYELGSTLRSHGIEFTYLAWHSEHGAGGDPNLHDSCIIGAIGGMIFPPKYMSFQSHCNMAAMCPYRTNAENKRGYPARSYVDRKNVMWADAEVDENILAKISNMNPLDVKEMYPNERLNQERVEPRKAGDQKYEVTASWPVIPNVRENLAKPSMFDATSQQWNGVGHWPLMVTVGDARARSEWSNCKRAAAWEEKKRENAQEGRKRSPSRGGKSQGYRGSSRARNSERPDARVSGERSSGSGWTERSSSGSRGSGWTGWTDRSSGSGWTMAASSGTLSSQSSH